MITGKFNLYFTELQKHEMSFKINSKKSYLNFNKTRAFFALIFESGKIIQLMNYK